MEEPLEIFDKFFTILDYKKQYKKEPKKDWQKNLKEYKKDVFIIYYTNIMEDQKKLQKQVEDLQNQLEGIENKNTKTSEELGAIEQELEGLKRSYCISWVNKKLLPDMLEGEFIAEERDNRLYLPLQGVLEDDDELDICGYIYRWDTPDEVIEYIKDHEREIIDSQAETIYYSDAIDYLKENDRTLTESLELAKNAWYDLENLNSCVLATLLKTENENYYWTFQDAIEKLEEKAEELNESREENKDATGLEMDEFIEQRAKNRADRHTENDWKPEELYRIEELQTKRQELKNQRDEGSTEYWKVREELNKAQLDLKELENLEELKRLEQPETLQAEK